MSRWDDATFFELSVGGKVAKYVEDPMKPDVTLGGTDHECPDRTSTQFNVVRLTVEPCGDEMLPMDDGRREEWTSHPPRAERRRGSNN